MIRHGESEANLARVMAGSLDSPLTALGRKQADQARVVVEHLALKPKLIVHSNLQRAKDTAAIINTNLDIPMIEDPDIAEIHVGDFEGVPWEQCASFRDWIDPPNGETFQQFFDRIKRAKKKHLGSNNDPVLIVCHGGVFKALWKMHGRAMPGVKNCHLHEFTPAKPSPSFPFQTHVYEYTEALVRTEVVYEDFDDSF